jgi:arachidonate 15-lipoxygenase
MARTAVQVADGNFHQAIAHLGHTHLVIEAAALAMYRNLAPCHPVRKLMDPHFEGSFYINDAADSELTRPGGGVDRVMAGTIEFSRKVACDSVLSWSFRDTMLENNLRARGLDNLDTLPDYPYRDDARLIWAAIRDWVESFLRIWYTDKKVREDVEIQAFFAELGAEDGGRLKDVPKPTTVVGLRDALTHIIFTGSAQHAAVNFPQLPIMSYTPAFPLAAFAASPGDHPADFQDWMMQLPPLAIAQLQQSLGQLLGGVHYTRLGDYKLGLFSGALDLLNLKDFADEPQTDGPRKVFKRRLEEIGDLIRVRNESRVPYEYLLPEKIPQSINI